MKKETHDLIRILAEIEIEENRQKVSSIRKAELFKKLNVIVGEMAEVKDE